LFCATLAAAGLEDVGEVALEAVVGDHVAAEFAVELDGDAVVGEAVAAQSGWWLSGWKGERSEPMPMAQ
jgi:hypothetical protein